MNTILQLALAKSFIAEVSDKVPSCYVILIAGAAIGLVSAIMGRVSMKFALTLMLIFTLLGLFIVFNEIEIVRLAINEMGTVYLICIISFFIELILPSAFLSLYIWRCGALKRKI